jgi:hypothetical protein
MRLPLVDVETLSPSQRAAVDWTTFARTVPHVVAHARETFIPLYRALLSLRDSPDLGPKLHEFLETSAAAATDCDYIWSRHEQILRSMASADEVEAVRERRRFGGREGIVVAFVDDLFAGRKPDDERLREVLEVVSVRGLVESILTYGLYSVFARVIEAAGIPADDEGIVTTPIVGGGGVAALYAEG